MLLVFCWRMRLDCIAGVQPCCVARENSCVVEVVRILKPGSKGSLINLLIPMASGASLLPDHFPRTIDRFNRTPHASCVV